MVISVTVEGSCASVKHKYSVLQTLIPHSFMLQNKFSLGLRPKYVLKISWSVMLTFNSHHMTHVPIIQQYIPNFIQRSYGNLLLLNLSLEYFIIYDISRYKKMDLAKVMSVRSSDGLYILSVVCLKPYINIIHFGAKDPKTLSQSDLSMS